MEGTNPNKPEKRIPVEYSEDTSFSDSNFLSEEMIHRDYAETGNTIANAPSKKPEIERVSFNPDDFNFDEETIPEIKDNQVADEELDDFENIPGGNSSEEDPEKVKLDKSIQRKLAKSQSRTITELYCFILLIAVKYICKIDESKIYSREAAGELNANTIIGNLPLIQHVKNHNAIIDELEIDEDSKEAIMEALEIYLTSLNIKTSPGLNLAIAMGTPALTLIMQGLHSKRQIKNLEKAAIMNHVPQQKIEIPSSNEKHTNLDYEQMQKEMEEMREKLRQSGLNDSNGGVTISQEKHETQARQPIPRSQSRKKEEKTEAKK